MIHPHSSLFKKNQQLFLCLMLSAFSSPTLSQTAITTFLDGQALTRDEGSPYLISTMLVVKEQQTVTIRQGCQLFFGPGAGVTVEGSLLAEGTVEEPVLFSSITDSLSPGNPGGTPGDSGGWTGITVSGKTATVKLKHCTIASSLEGISAGVTGVELTDVSFRGNGVNFTLDGVGMEVTELRPYNYPFTIKYDPNGAVRGAVPLDTLRYVKDAPAVILGNSGRLKKPLYDFTGWTLLGGDNGVFAPFDTFMMGQKDAVFSARWGKVLVRKGIPLAIGCCGIGAAAMTAWAIGEWRHNRDDYEDEPNPRRQDEYRNSGKNASAVAFACGIVATATIPFSVVLYVGNHRPRH